MTTVLHPSGRLLVLAACMIAVGCRSYISYAPRPVDSTSSARQIIHKMLDQQPGSNAAIEIEVTDDKVRMLRSRSNWIFGTSGIFGTTIYYAQIGDVLLSHKGAWFAVTIRALNRVPILHVYAADQSSAERFIDALETMRRAAGMRVEPGARTSEAQ